MKPKLLPFFLLFIICISISNKPKAQAVNVQDSLALVDLYNSTNGPSWNNHTNWLTGPVSTWYGITLYDNRILIVRLIDNNLIGTIPSSLGNLSNLNYLYLSYNQLNDTIPSSLSNLVNLKELLLDNNQLVGRIPPSLGNMLNLTILNLQKNQLSDTIPSSLGNLSNLISLLLDYNQLTGVIPSSLGNLVNVHNLWLRYNQLSGTIPPSLGNLNNIYWLFLNSNKLSGNIPPSLGNMGSLLLLYLSGNQLSGSIPSSLSNLPRLTGLDLSFNQLSNSIPFSFGSLGMLSNLNLSNNQLTGAIPLSIGNLPHLNYLYLSNNQLSGSIPSSLGNLHELEILDLTNNRLSEEIPSSIGSDINLSTISLNNNQLSGNIPSSFGSFKNIFKIDLSFNQLSGTIPIELGNLKTIRTLSLNENQLIGTIPSTFSNLSLLQILYLESNKLSGDVSVIANIPLYKVDLSNNYFTFNGIELLAQKELEEFIYNNQAPIPVHQNTNTLSTSAGGTLSNNTYKWFSVGQADSTTIVGDSVFIPSQNGKYYASVTNSICTQLTLYTDTIDYELALPVTVINLKAQQQESSIKIGWSSLTETNITNYEIQRSANTNNFSMVGVLPAKGNGTQQQNYNFNDLQPLAGNNYYRLKIINKDGTARYSKIVLVNISKDKAITLVYPIPAKDILHIQLNESATFSLINQSGKVLLITVINGNGVMNLSGITEGMYYLKNNGTGAVQKIIISR